MTRGLWSMVLALGLFSASACESAPHGPGTLQATLTGESLGGVLLEVAGSGIVGFEALGSTRVYSAPLTTPDDTHRVLMIDPDGTGLRLEIRVSDVGMDDLAIHVVSATGQDNSPQPSAGIETRVERWSPR